jgi:hypothetical protein
MTSWDLTPNPLTPAMEEVIQMRSKRVSVEIDIPITPEPSGQCPWNPLPTADVVINHFSVL